MAIFSMGVGVMPNAVRPGSVGLSLSTYCGERQGMRERKRKKEGEGERQRETETER